MPIDRRVIHKISQKDCEEQEKEDKYDDDNEEIKAK